MIVVSQYDVAIANAGRESDELPTGCIQGWAEKVDVSSVVLAAGEGMSAVLIAVRLLLEIPYKVN
jgi:hypothetical protein